MEVFMKLTSYKTGLPVLVKLTGQNAANEILEDYARNHVINLANKDDTLTVIKYHNKQVTLVQEKVDEIWEFTKSLMMK